MKIRLEEENDYTEVEKLNRDSFWNIYRPGAYEHFIVHNLRKTDSFIKDLTYVIENNGRIIGNINYSIGRIDYENSSADAVVLGPVAIDKEYQNQGLGFKLIDYTLKLAQEMNIPFVIVIGDENYYSRFGFVSASKHNIYLEGTDFNEENPFFMIRIFDESKMSGEMGIFHNSYAFDVDENELDEFDKQFEYKEKLILKGQLGV